MNIVVRTDGDSKIGTGHIIRCLALSTQLKIKGAEVKFALTYTDWPLKMKIMDAGFEIIDANNYSAERPDALIVDNYELSAVWERTARLQSGLVIAIDDLNREHDCDIIVDPNFYAYPEKRYQTSICKKKLIGAEYTLLRQEFTEARKNMKERDGKVKNALICFGGSDGSNATLKALRAIAGSQIAIDVVVGSVHSDINSVKKYCEDRINVKLHIDAKNMAELMLKNDIAIGAGGTMSWERCALGLPTVVIAIADNQLEICAELQNKGAIVYLGEDKDISEGQLANAFLDLAKDSKKMKQLSKNAAELIDAKGAERVAQFIINYKPN